MRIGASNAAVTMMLVQGMAGYKADRTMGSKLSIVRHIRPITLIAEASNLNLSFRPRLLRDFKLIQT